MNASCTDVLIVGAGPTGLVLALWLTRQGVKVRIVDKDDAKASTSRALVIHSRTLELYRQLDLAEKVVANGHKIEATNIWSEGSHRGHVPLGDVGSGLTPYPFLHIYPQDRHEPLLEKRLNELGVQVERHKELVDFTEHDSSIMARFRDTTKPSSPDQDTELETYEATFIAGCDGSHSVVRRSCGIEFEGETHKQSFFVADIEGSGPVLNGEAHVTFNQSDILLTLAYDKGRRGRLNGVIDQKNFTKDISELTLDDISQDTIKKMKLQIDKVNWFTAYHVHHRLSQSFRKGRAFLVGDAGHIHSPVGGQGMNTGIGDAINLAWKLATVVQGRADPSLLDTYESERRAFATSLVHTTDKAFNFLATEGFFASFLRTWLIPMIMPFLTKFRFVRHNMFSRISQILINYRHSTLSAGSTGLVQGGDRMPWAPVGEVDNFDSLKAITWQVHVYGAAKDELTQWCQSMKIPLHAFPWHDEYQRVGLATNAAYLIRPDTYIAVAEASGLPERFDQYLKDNNLRLT
ncbi:hypothetical protein AJ80_01760 [Polytolypa hystricis UAMH7299]|uniref:FAD-binding domain-containing protein n=1 Tax=Polytolypa hystricis (strain UAMH7299) TaxID=1447883 RepID=A0A2B7YZY9_POLH7|nr:hypothetical protein AJ80_01760 [Polytolypa hystricis UAMH7299]